jgi:guanylate kinase
VSLGNIFVISAPSGTGKSSLLKELCRLDNRIKISISHTTRNIRSGEIDGEDYYFITKDKFDQMVKNKEFLEYANVYGNYYGTDINTINKFMANGDDIILEIDWQGAEQTKSIFNSAILIYIMPPSLEELERRLRSRNTDSEETIAKRLSLAKEDMSHAHKFNHIIINDKFEDALKELYSIIMESR